MSEWLIGLSEYIGDMSYELDSVKAENEKLRELVRIALVYCVNDRCEEGCPLCESNALLRLCRLRDEARELGVDAQ